jgi:hypothetical protein
MSAPAIKAIPTEYAGVEFRSRLEAKWAAFFDRCAWRWSYEPQDFNGYIPDFALWFRTPILVEVKPLLWDEDNASDARILEDARTKIARSGIKGELLTVGTRVLVDGAGHQRLGMLMDVDHATDEASPWSWAFAFGCTHCNRRSFANEDASWHCRNRGCYDEYNGRAHLDAWDAEEDFRRASSEVQWRPR